MRMQDPISTRSGLVHSTSSKVAKADNSLTNDDWNWLINLVRKLISVDLVQSK